MKNKILNILQKKEVRIEKVMAVPPFPSMLKEKRALVIGGTRGIGKAIVERLSQAGAKVIIAGRSTPNLDEYSVGKEMLEYIKFDVTQFGMYDSFLDMVAKSGGVDILVNCSGIQSKSEENKKGFLDITIEDWDYVMNVNLKSVYFLCQKYAHMQIAQKRSGCIINVGSVIGLKPRSTPYGISKWGVVDVTKALGTVLAKYDIRVNGIAPGLVNTAMMKSEFADNPDNYFRLDHPDGRCACVDDIANIALFLASDYSKHIAGEVIVCDGSEINQ